MVTMSYSVTMVTMNYSVTMVTMNYYVTMVTMNYSVTMVTMNYSVTVVTMVKMYYRFDLSQPLVLLLDVIFLAHVDEVDNRLTW